MDPIEVETLSSNKIKNSIKVVFSIRFFPNWVYTHIHDKATYEVKMSKTTHSVEL